MLYIDFYYVLGVSIVFTILSLVPWEFLAVIVFYAIIFWPNDAVWQLNQWYFDVDECPLQPEFTWDDFYFVLALTICAAIVLNLIIFVYIRYLPKKTQI